MHEYPLFPDAPENWTTFMKDVCMCISHSLDIVQCYVAGICKEWKYSRLHLMFTVTQFICYFF